MTPYEQGFLSKCQSFGISGQLANGLLKLAYQNTDTYDQSHLSGIDGVTITDKSRIYQSGPSRSFDPNEDMNTTTTRSYSVPEGRAGGFSGSITTYFDRNTTKRGPFIGQKSYSTDAKVDYGPLNGQQHNGLVSSMHGYGSSEGDLGNAFQSQQDEMTNMQRVAEGMAYFNSDASDHRWEAMTGAGTGQNSPANQFQETVQQQQNQPISKAAYDSLLKAAESSDPNLQRASEIFKDWLTTKKHTVRNGEVLSGIARKYNVSLEDIQKENNLSSVLAIKPGQQIKIPVAQKA